MGTLFVVVGSNLTVTYFEATMFALLPQSPFFLNGYSKSKQYPSQIKELDMFIKDLLELVKTVKFRNRKMMMMILTKLNLQRIFSYYEIKQQICTN